MVLESQTKRGAQPSHRIPASERLMTYASGLSAVMK